MINKFIPISTVVDSYLDDIDNFAEGEAAIPIIERQIRRIANDLYSKTNSPKTILEITGKIKDNMIVLPDDYCEFKNLNVDGEAVNVHGMQKHLRGNVTKGSDTKYQAKLVGDYIMFNVIGGTYNLDGKQYTLEYKTVPLVDGELYVPEQFQDAIIARMEYKQMKNKIASNGRGVELLREFRKEAEEKETNATTSVDFPSFDELINIGKIYESKVPASLKTGNKNNFNNV